MVMLIKIYIWSPVSFRLTLDWLLMWEDHVRSETGVEVELGGPLS